jgi:hypothetical protein
VHRISKYAVQMRCKIDAPLHRSGPPYGVCGAVQKIPRTALHRILLAQMLRNASIPRGGCRAPDTRETGAEIQPISVIVIVPQLCHTFCPTGAIMICREG